VYPPTEQGPETVTREPGTLEPHLDLAFAGRRVEQRGPFGDLDQPTTAVPAVAT
jgi:hypothetical protein